jgi:hypothetical protein
LVAAPKLLPVPPISTETLLVVRVLGDLASVDIGAVTGANDFFLLATDDEPGIARQLLKPGAEQGGPPQRLPLHGRRPHPP